MLVVSTKDIKAGTVVFEPKELEVLIHALVAERGKVVDGQTNYGPMTIGEFAAFIDQLQTLRRGVLS